MSISRTRSLTVVAVAVMSTLIISATGLPETGGERLRAADSPVLQRIFANWKARSERVKSFHFTWDTVVRIPKGVPDRTWERDVKTPRQVQYTLPRYEFWAEGNDHFRRECQVVSYHRDHSFDLKSRHVSTFDGTHDRTLMLPGDPAGRPRGSTRNLEPTDFLDVETPDHSIPPFPRRKGTGIEGWWEETEHIEHLPLLLALRPFKPVLLHWGLENCSVVRDSKKAGYVELERRDEQFRSFERCWVDPTRDDIVVALELLKPDGRTVTAAQTIEYQHDAKFGWVPSQWSYKLAGSFALTAHTTECKVTKYAINEHFPPATFLLTFPPGTELFDRSQQEWFVRKDGTRRLVPRGKNHPTYEQLLQEDDSVPDTKK